MAWKLRFRNGAAEDSSRPIWNITACLLIVTVVSREVLVSADSYRGFEGSVIFLFHRKAVQEVNTQIAGTRILEISIKI